MCTNEHSQRNPGTTVGAAMVNGIVFPPCFIEEGVRINTEFRGSYAGRLWVAQNTSTSTSQSVLAQHVKGANLLRVPSENGFLLVGVEPLAPVRRDARFFFF